MAEKSKEFVISRVFEAPRELVYSVYIKGQEQGWSESPVRLDAYVARIKEGEA